MRSFVGFFLLFSLIALTNCSPVDTSGLDQQAVVFHATSAVERLKGEGNFHKSIAPKLKEARAVALFPALYKGGFLLGGEYGNGVLLIRNANGQWSYPVFCRIAGGTIGLQIGGQAAQTLYVIMTDDALQAVLDDSFRATAEVNLAAWSAGAGIGSSTTTNLSDDIYAYSLANGLFGGMTLGGGALSSRPDWNGYYYNGVSDPGTILFHNGASNPQADQLRDALSQF